MASEFSAIEPPFWAGLVASFIRQHGCEVMILDADAEGLSHEETANRIKEVHPKLVAIVVQGANPSASSTPKMGATIEFCKVMKQSSDIPILIGGTHPSALPHQTSKETGAIVCIGELFNAIPSMFRVFGSGWPCYGVIDRYELLPADQLPPVAWDLLDMTKYRAHNWHCLDRLDQRSPYAVIYTSLGCPYDCSFCTIHSYFAGKPSIRFRPMDSVIEEIDLLVEEYNVKNIKIMDELFTLKEDRVNQFCDALIERDYGLNMWAYARFDEVNLKMFERMKRAGINWLGYGLESAHFNIRADVGKRFRNDDVEEAIDRGRDAGIYQNASIMFGLPNDDMDSMQRTLDLVEFLNFEYINFYCATAYPGSKLYEDAVKNGVELPDSWEGYGQLHPNFKPLPTKHLTSKQVRDFRDYAFNHYFSRLGYLGVIKDKFGSKAMEHIIRMFRVDIRGQ